MIELKKNQVNFLKDASHKHELKNKERFEVLISGILSLLGRWVYNAVFLNNKSKYFSFVLKSGIIFLKNLRNQVQDLTVFSDEYYELLNALIINQIAAITINQ